jgi:hypothetical protein
MSQGEAYCRIPELMNFRKSSFGYGKMPESQFDYTKPSYKSLSCMLKMVLCFSCDGVPFKIKTKNGQASNL